MEDLALLLSFLTIDQKLLTEELNPVDLDPLYALFGERDHRHSYLITATFSHHLYSQQLGGYVNSFVFNATDNIASHILFQLILLFHGLCEC